MVAAADLGHQPRLQDRTERREGARDHPQGQQVRHPTARQAQDQPRQPEREER